MSLPFTKSIVFFFQEDVGIETDEEYNVIVPQI